MYGPEMLFWEHVVLGTSIGGWPWRVSEFSMIWSKPMMGSDPNSCQPKPILLIILTNSDKKSEKILTKNSEKSEKILT